MNDGISSDKNVVIKLLRPDVRNRMLRKKVRIVESQAYRTGGSLLNYGAKTGFFSHRMEKRGWKVTSVEKYHEERLFSLEMFHHRMIDVPEMDALHAGTFDVITMWHVLEHVDDLKWQIEQLHRLTKTKGRIVIAVPNYKSYDAQYYKELWAAYDVPRHLSHFNKNVLTKIFKSKNLELVRTDKLIWDAYYISYMSEQYKQHKFPLLKGTFRGCISNCKARHTNEWSSMVYIFEKK